MNLLFVLCLATLLVCRPALAGAEAETAELTCSKSATFLAPPDNASPRHYAPDKEVQMLHLALDVTPDFERRTIAATASLRFKPLVKAVRELKLDAVDLNIREVHGTETIQAWQVTPEQVIITFASPIPADKEAAVTLDYSAEPTEGLYFRTPEMGYLPGDAHLFSQGEEIEARHWYPCLDSPNQRFTSEITCRVPEGMSVVSNGRLVSENKDPATGLLASHWSQEKPHANYLVSLVAGYFRKLEDTCHGVPLAFYVPASEIDQAAGSFRDTKDMLEFFEKETGVPYPWAKYYQVCVNDFVAGGMENTSATTLTDRTLFTPASENLHDSDGLIAHELAHQWFGDLVTCKDWSHVWLNEGFATFYENLYDGHKHGRDSMLYSLYGRARMITGLTNDFNPIVRRTYGEPREMFGYLVYPKAGWVLHMLRARLGPDLFHRCIRTYLERHQYANVVTEDLRAVIEELSGRSFDQFFDQWFYHGHFPELEIKYEWDEPGKLAKLSVRQTQEVNSNVLLFKVPLTVRFHNRSGNSEQVLEVTKRQEDFYVPLESAPDLVRIDPDYTLLARIKFTVPRPMLDAQLADSNDMVGRLLAIEQLAAGRDKESVTRLEKVLKSDSFYGVRIEAARALRSIRTDEALEALLASSKQPDARVRLEVVQDSQGFYDQKAFAFARSTLEEEKNPDIRAAGARALGGYAKPDAQPELVRLLGSKSYRNELADAAIAGLRSQDDPAAVAPLLAELSQHEPDFTSRGFGQGLETLAYLSRNQENPDAVCSFLKERLNDRKQVVKLAAIRALGTLGDAQALPALESFANASKQTPERTVAELAVATLRAGRKPVDDFKNLRQEVLDLEKSNRDLRQELEDLKKRYDAGLESTNAGSKSKVRKRKP